MRSQRKAGPAVGTDDGDSYWYLSTRPLHVLVFLLPLLVLYEVGTLLFLRSDQGMVEVILARQLMSQALNAFGGVGFHLPPILLAVVLVLWHVLEKDRLRVRRGVLAGMGVESFLWTLPLIVLAAIAGAAPPMLQLADAAPPVESQSVMARITLSVGAGLYEEMVFRLALIAGIHWLLVDMFKSSDTWAYALAAVVSALAFTIYHNLTHGGASGINPRLVVTYLVAGLYFAMLFILRGFGVVVATHAIYDVFALVILADDQAG